MSEMVLDLDLVAFAYHRLRDDSEFQKMVTDGLIGTDAADTATADAKVAQAWLFQGLDSEGRPFRDPEGSGKAVVVLSERREWAGANPHNSPAFPALQMLIYADSDRNSDGTPTTRNADRKCKHIFKRLDRRFHRPAHPATDQRWTLPETVTNPDGSTTVLTRYMHVHSCLRGAPFVIGDVPLTGAYTVRGEAVYHTITD